MASFACPSLSSLWASSRTAITEPSPLPCPETDSPNPSDGIFPLEERTSVSTQYLVSSSANGTPSENLKSISSGTLLRSVWISEFTAPLALLYEVPRLERAIELNLWRSNQKGYSCTWDST